MRSRKQEERGDNANHRTGKGGYNKGRAFRYPMGFDNRLYSGLNVHILTRGILSCVSFQAFAVPIQSL